MTIEKSPAPASNHKPATTAASQGAKARAASADSTPDAAGGGFMAILGALGDASADASSSAIASPATTATTGTTVAVADGVAAGASASDVPTGGAALEPLDASTLLQQNPQIAAAQAQQAAADAATAAATAAAISAHMAAIAASAGAAVQDPAAMAQARVLNAAPALLPVPPATVPSSPAAPTPVSSASPKLGDATARSAATQAAAALATSANDSQDTVASATQGLQHANARAKPGKEALLPGAGADADSTTASSANAVVADAPNKFLAAMEQARAQAGSRSTEPVLAPLLVKGDKAEKATGERGGSGIKSADPTYSSTSPGVGATDASQSGAAAPVQAPEMQVAEQVRYWVSNNVQNAELQLDGLGQSPVDVSIRMQGNEAHITFRTDESATREVLQNASAHLKTMLQGEGLLLGGVSVGSSGSGNADGGERRGRQNARQVAIAPLQIASAGGAPRVGAGTSGGVGRAVDLFV